MKVLIIGSGGREHALVDAVDRSPLLTALFVAPGNPGMEEMATRVDLAVDDLDGIVDFAGKEAIDLVIIGPEAPLVAGLADRLDDAGIAVFGPSAAAAELEGSKGFARGFCARHQIPQPGFAWFESEPDALEHLRTHYADSGVVIKADGLAAGKGVIVADNLKQAEDAVTMILDGGAFGSAGASVVIEDRIEGVEASLFALVDGRDAILMGTAQDYKRAHDGDEGPNTGGMGAISPAPGLDDATLEKAWQDIVLPTVRGMAEEGRPYRGFLYTGLMLTKDGPQVIEYNCRFGDPEAEVILPRLHVDLLSAILTAVEGGLGHSTIRFHDNVTVTVIMANGGYPGAYEKGGVITGLDHDPDHDDAATTVFHAGTARDDNGAIIATGGRVLAVTGEGPDAETARAAAYDRVSRINWPGAFYRKDIGKAR